MAELLFLSLAKAAPPEFAAVASLTPNLLRGQPFCLFIDDLRATQALVAEFAEDAVGVLITQGPTLGRRLVSRYCEHLQLPPTLIHDAARMAAASATLLEQTFQAEVRCRALAVENDRLRADRKQLTLEHSAYRDAMAREVSERQRAETVAQEQETLMRAFLEASYDGVVIIDTEGRIVEWNPAQARMTGVSREAALGAPLVDLQWRMLGKDAELTPERAVSALASLNKALAAGGPNNSEQLQEFVVRRPDGTQAILQQNIFPIAHAGRFQFGGICRDVSRRREAEAGRQKLVMALEQAGDGIVITDPHGMIEYVNAAFERMSGYTREEVLGRTPRIMKSGKHDDAFYQHLWNTILSGKTWSGRFINRRKEGEQFIEECSISPVFGRGGHIEHFVAAKKEMTAQLRLEEDLRHAQRMESVGRLAAGVAHDLNNLLTPILGYAEMIALDLHPADERFQQMQEIKRAGERARDLTHQLLSFARKQVLQLKPIDLRVVVTGMEKLIRRTLREDIALDVRPGDTPCIIVADVRQLEQVLMNLTVNAQDAMPKGGHLSFEISRAELDATFCAAHSGTEPGWFGVLAVTDTGTGMSDEVRQKIFEPFFSTKGDQGTGLGLATVYGIVQQHGGTVWVYSELGHGSTFRVYLPLVREAQAVTLVETPPADTSLRRGHETVLLVEDDESVRGLARTTLERHGYTVLVAKNGPEALMLLEQHQGIVELLLTDVIMPGMNGRELSERLQQHVPNLKTIYMSGYTDNVLATHNVLGPDTFFIQKPFSVREFLVTLREVLGKDSER